MSRKKLRILHVGEASFLSTGFSTYSLELLRRLHDSGKYELMEYASYSPWGDERARGLPWRHKSAMYNPAVPGEREVYHSNPINQFGEWKFEEACIEFMPDAVVTTRDWWMDEHVERSPFRHLYHWAYMPTVDAEPQDEQWLSTYMNADAVFAYSDWGLDLLREQSRGRIRTVCSTPPGADLATYEVKPDKRAHKERMGLDPDCFLVGTVMRNQRRKLYPEFIEAFASFLKTAPAGLAKKTFLYLHTGWPDVGWDIPRLLKEAGIAAKTLFTYHCRTCGTSFPAFFQDTRAFCRACNQPAATFPTTQLGVSRRTLSEVLNLFDVYVQYANSEGFGMPQIEAAACGVPVMATDYSAMSDVVRKVRGMPIKVLTLVREPDTHCKRAIPDPDDFVAQLTRFLLMPEPVRQRRGREARQAVEEHYTWDRTASLWMNHFDSIEVRPHQETWLSPFRPHQPATHIPAGLSNEEFVRWGMTHVAGRPDLADSYVALRMVRDLNWGVTLGQGMGGTYFNEASTLGVRERFQDFDREKAYATMTDMANKRNRWERIRSERCRA